MVRVFEVRPDTIIQDICRLMAYLPLAGKIPTIIKDNISWHFPFPGANTTPWQLDGVLNSLRYRGFNDVCCVGNKTVVTNAFKGDDLNKIKIVLNKYGVPLYHNFNMKWVKYEPKAKMLVLDKIFEEILIPEFFIGKNIIHLPTVKCHIYTTTTGAMKNAFGGLLNINRHYTHSWIHETLVDLLQIQKEIHPGIYAVMDGTTCGDGPGPRTMRPVIKNVMLASDDQVAIDAVAAHMMGFDPMKIKYIRLAHEMGLGQGRIEEIEIEGIDIRKINWKFSVGKNLARRVGGDIFWFGPLKKIQKFFFHTPLVRLFILGSEIYHDYFRWPFIEKKIYREWLKTDWGKLFDSY